VPADRPPRPLEIRWLKRASASLEVEADYIARDRPEAAQRLLDTIARAVQLLAQHPGLGRPGRVEGTRELVVPDTPYLVPYRVRGNAIEILRVFHGARMWPKKL
jgi:toxin ParE1/3/4